MTRPGWLHRMRGHHQHTRHVPMPARISPADWTLTYCSCGRVWSRPAPKGDTP